MEHLLIRRVTPDDAAKIVAYLNQIGGESDNLLFGQDEFGMTAEQERTFLENMQKAGNSCMLLAFDGEELVAMASMQLNSRARIAHRANLALTVRQSHWRRGIGAQMLQALIDLAPSYGLTMLELEVRAGNKGAIALYERFGFQHTGTFHKFYIIRGEYQDAYLMQLDLTQNEGA